MTTQNLSLFKALGAKMEFLNQRQRVLSQNISNADTPGYIPKDLKDLDFRETLKNVEKDRRSAVYIERTRNSHMSPAGEIFNPQNRENKKTYEVAPAGNAVVMEEQLVKTNKNMIDYNLMTNMYQKNIRMLKTALGKQQ
ncbi:MAG: flagellar basal body rod protein FlgB [Alphaproteobacteria bacterium]